MNNSYIRKLKTALTANYKLADTRYSETLLDRSDCTHDDTMLDDLFSRLEGMQSPIKEQVFVAFCLSGCLPRSIE